MCHCVMCYYGIVVSLHYKQTIELVSTNCNNVMMKVSFLSYSDRKTVTILLVGDYFTNYKTLNVLHYLVRPILLPPPSVNIAGLVI